MEALPGVEPGDYSIPRRSGRRSEGRELAGLDSNQRRRTVQSRSAPADRATGHQSPSPGSNWAGCPYKGPPDAGPKGAVSPARFERALPTSSRWCLLPLGYEDMEPPPGADPGHPPYEGEAAAVRGGEDASLRELGSNQR